MPQQLAFNPNSSEQFGYGLEDGEEFHEDEHTCNFCERYDPEFNQDTIDLHYWKDCPMLTRCTDCDQVVEVQSMAEHHLQECAQSHFYKWHETCKMPILKADAHKHKCTKPKPAGAVKCPLCQDNVFPNTNAGWKKHLLVDECRENHRRVIKTTS